MDDLNGAGGTPVSKRQKNAQLDDALCDFVDEVQKATGATYSRILTAALLHYFFLEPWGRDPFWMQLAVSLERGDLTVPFAASRAIDYRLSKAERMRNILAESGSPETVTPLVLDVARLRDAKHAIAQVLENADNPLSAMIAAFTTPEWPGGLSVPAKKD